MRRLAFTIGVPYKKFIRAVQGPIDLENATSVHIWLAARGLLDAKLSNLLAIRAELDRRMRVAERRAEDAKLKRGRYLEQQNTN